MRYCLCRLLAGIVMLSTILSSLIFTSTVFAYLGSDVADLKYDDQIPLDKSFSND